jgi:hypothetical protein
MRVSGPYQNYFSRSLNENESVLAYAKYVDRTNAAGALVTAAQIQVQANSLLFTVNGAAETLIGTYTGNSGADNEVVYADANIASIQNMIDTINGFGAGMVAAGTTFNRWRAGWGDFRPQYVIGAGDATAAAAANALLGYNHLGLAILADNSNHPTPTISVGIPLVGAREGAGQRHPDHFESDYTSTVAGVVTRRRFSQVRREEEQPISETQVVIQGIATGATFAGDTQITVYDRLGNIVFNYLLAALVTPPANVLSADNPIIGPMGSPLWVEINGTAGGAITDGTTTVWGYVGVA